MTYKVLVVDDSVFFQSRLKQIINQHPDLEVVGVAANGQEAVELARKLLPDVISMDYEMPYMDGITALRAILAERSVPIVMFSSLTYEGAKTTLDALAAGAVDFIPKNLTEVSKNADSLKKKLNETLLTFARKYSAAAYLAEHRARKAAADANAEGARAKAEPARKPLGAAAPKPRAAVGPLDIIIIGTSTGGPVALTELLTKIPASFRVPIVVVQHMPEHFTLALAERLNRQCALAVVEAGNGMTLEAGKVYVAPGGHQCIFNRGNTLKIMVADERVTYQPSVDVTFASAASIFGSRVLGIVLTGMGNDGCEGARLLKQKGATIWGQNKESCVVYGMPKAVAEAGLVDCVLPLQEIGPRISKL